MNETFDTERTEALRRPAAADYPVLKAERPGAVVDPVPLPIRTLPVEKIVGPLRVSMRGLKAHMEAKRK